MLQPKEWELFSSKVAIPDIDIKDRKASSTSKPLELAGAVLYPV
jgi:hypothetical protein